MPRASLLALPLSLLLATPAQASMQTTTGLPLSIRGHLGLGATFWTYDASKEIYGSKTYLDQQFSQKASPYVMRQLEFWISVFGVDISINYLSSTLFGFAGVSSEEPPVGAVDKVAALLGANADYIILRGLGLHIGTNFRRFEIHQTYLGNSFLGVSNMYYNDAKGESRLLSVNDGVQFFTHSSDIELGVLVGIGELFTFDFGGDEPGMPFYFGLGYKRRAYNAPMLVSLDGPNAEYSADSLINAELVSNAFWFSARYTGQADPVTDPWAVRVIANVSLGPPTMNTYYFNATAGLYTELYLEFALTYAFTLGGEVSGSVQLGAYAAAVLTQLSQLADDTVLTTTHDLPWIDQGGDQRVLAKGTRGQVDMDRAELYWGPYLNIAVQW